MENIDRHGIDFANNRTNVFREVRGQVYNSDLFLSYNHFQFLINFMYFGGANHPSDACDIRRECIFYT